jgi:hypothetical protein
LRNVVSTFLRQCEKLLFQHFRENVDSKNIHQLLFKHTAEMLIQKISINFFLNTLPKNVDEKNVGNNSEKC